jgi:hypothetical protein
MKEALGSLQIMSYFLKGLSQHISATAIIKTEVELLRENYSDDMQISSVAFSPRANYTD